MIATKITTVIAFVWILFNQRQTLGKINFSSVEQFNNELFILALLLTPLNWYCEYLKWKVTLKTLNCYNAKVSVESFLSGIFSGFITPNFIGNFIGRVLYYPFKIRPKIILFTLLANYSQFLTTITIGAFSLAFLSVDNSFVPSDFNWIIYLFVVIGWIFYFFFEKMNLQRVAFLSFVKHFQLAQSTTVLKIQYVYYNVLRYIVFSIQYLCMLNVFSEKFDYQLYGYVTLIYFWSTLIPNIIWGKLFLRETVALVVLLPILANANVILLASILLTVVNQILPALIGIPYLVKKKKYE